MTPRAVAATFACLLALTPQVGAAAVFTPDPARDALVTQDGLGIPVDSIDILGFTTYEAGPNLRGASISVVDLSRRGLEDRLFVQSAHQYRAWSYVEFYSDYRTINLVAVQVDQDPALRYAAFLIWPGGYEQLPVSFTFDDASDSMAWKLQKPLAGEPTHRFAIATLFGCDNDDECQPSLPAARAYDMAPNELARPITQIAPPVWWDALLPEDDGTVPPYPVSVAALAASAS